MTTAAKVPRYLEGILAFTAFAAGTVDVITFAKLGGILASAMTGNLAFLGYYLARHSYVSALGSAIALAGFIMGGVIGTLLGRRRSQRGALAVLLSLEVVLLGAAVAVWLALSHQLGSLQDDAVIVLLAVCMGLQSIVGKRVNLSNIPTIVFTSTLTNIVVGLTDTLASGKLKMPVDTGRQITSFMAYFFGALCAGYLVYFHIAFLIALPATAVGSALLCLAFSAA